MRRIRPLVDTNPELSILDSPSFREYRVENWHLSRNGSGKVIQGATGLTWRLALLLIILALIYPAFRESRWAFLGLYLLLAYIVWAKCTQVLYESVIIIPPHGIQLETHFGFPPSYVLSTSKRFIPMSSLQDFVINEGLRRWSVRYYLTAIYRRRSGSYAMQVAYENILPHFLVLVEVYDGVQNILFAAGKHKQI